MIFIYEVNKYEKSIHIWTKTAWAFVTDWDHFKAKHYNCGYIWVVWHGGQLKPFLLPQLCISGGRYCELKRQRSWRQWAGRQWPWRHASWTFIWYVYISRFLIFLLYMLLSKKRCHSGWACRDVALHLWLNAWDRHTGLNILNSLVVFHPNNQNKNHDQGISRLNLAEIF